MSILLNAFGSREELPCWALMAHILVSATLSAGLLTPIAAVLAPALRLFDPPSAILGTEGVLYVTLLSALALAMLSPGAYSIDAHRFGRRVIALPGHDSKRYLSRRSNNTDR
jgi:hypothetical protein